MSNKINIVIDGLCGVGKFIVVKEVSKKLNYVFINSGSVYRVIVFSVIKMNVDFEIESEVFKMFSKIEIDLDEYENIFFNGINVLDVIRDDKVVKVVLKVV